MRRELIAIAVLVTAAAVLVALPAGDSDGSGFALEIDDEGCITGYTGTVPSDLCIPAEVDGKTVLSIGRDVFRDCTGIRSLTFAEDSQIEIIYACAFGGCTGLTGHLELPNSLQTLTFSVFNDCTGITSVKLPESLRFGGFLYFLAFEGCTSLTSFEVPEANEYLSGHDGCVLTKDGKVLLEVPEGATEFPELPAETNEVSAVALTNCVNLQGRLVVPEGVAMIWPGAFRGCDGITEAYIPSTFSDGGCPFLGCDNLRSVEVDPDNPSYTSVDGVLYTRDMGTVCEVPAKCVEVPAIPEGVTGIGDDAFRGCAGLTYMYVPDSVTVIGDSAFSDCPNLKEISIPGDVLMETGGLADNGLETVTFRGAPRLFICDDYSLTFVADDGTPFSFGPGPVGTYHKDPSDGNAYLMSRVTFDTCGGTPVEEQWLRTGAVPEIPANPTLEGRIFTGWELDGQPYAFDTAPDGDIVLTAVWEAGLVIGGSDVADNGPAVAFMGVVLLIAAVAAAVWFNRSMR